MAHEAADSARSSTFVVGTAPVGFGQAARLNVTPFDLPPRSLAGPAVLSGRCPPKPVPPIRIPPANRASFCRPFFLRPWRGFLDLPRLFMILLGRPFRPARNGGPKRSALHSSFD